MSKPMTNYNERLDEVIGLLNARMPQPKTINEAKARVAMCHEAKQAITSLIKELVVEAKPEKRELIEPITGKPVSRGDKVTVDVEADPRGSFIFVQNNGYNMALNQFEQNLLKALEEV